MMSSTKPPESVVSAEYCARPGTSRDTSFGVSDWRSGSACGPGDPQLAHVAHVEESGRLAHREVLGDHSRKLHRHLPAGERNEPAAEFLVEAVERGAAERHPGDYRNDALPRAP